MTYSIMHETYHNLLCCMLFRPLPVQGFAQCMSVHLQMEEDWCRFWCVSELLLHTLHYILPS